MEKKWTKREICTRIAENMLKEAEAIKEYLPLLNDFEDNGDKKSAGMVREIIGDEKNHQILLMGLLQKYDGGIPVAADGVQQVLGSIRNNLKEDGDED
jgi:rubrerythrin